METPSGLAEVIRVAGDALKAGMFVCMPGKVTAYDSGRQTVDVKPQFQRVIETDDPDEAFVYEELPIVPDVPIGWMSSLGGTLAVTMPLQAGDPVMLIFCDFDPGQWREKGEPTTPGDLRAHGLGNAWAFPGGIRPNAGKLAANLIHASKMVLGGGVFLGTAAATESLVKGDAHKVEYDAHIHPTPMGPSGMTTPMTALSTKHKLDA